MTCNLHFAILPSLSLFFNFSSIFGTTCVRMLCSRHRCRHRRLFVCWVPAAACVLTMAGVPVVTDIPAVADVLSAAVFLLCRCLLASLLFLPSLLIWRPFCLWASLLRILLFPAHAVVVDHAVSGIPAVAGSLLLQLCMHIIE